MQNKFIVPLLLLASIILVVGFFLITPTFVTTNGDLKTFQDNEVSFTYPSNWTAYDYENPMKIPFLMIYVEIKLSYLKKKCNNILKS